MQDLAFAKSLAGPAGTQVSTLVAARVPRAETPSSAPPQSRRNRRADKNSLKKQIPVNWAQFKHTKQGRRLWKKYCCQRYWWNSEGQVNNQVRNLDFPPPMFSHREPPYCRIIFLLFVWPLNRENIDFELIW